MLRKSLRTLLLLLVLVTALPNEQVRAAEQEVFDFGENNVEISDTLSIQVINEKESSTIRITESGEEIYLQDLSYVQITDFHQIELENDRYGVITYRHDGSANALYFEVIKLGQPNAELIFTSDVFERATQEINENRITINYPKYDEKDSMVEPSSMLRQEFIVKDNSVEAKGATTLKLEDESKAKIQTNKKYTNPSFKEINVLLTKKAREANIPPEVLKAIAFQESSMNQYWNTVPESVKKCKTDGKKTLSWDGTNALLGFDCIGIGIMQVSDHMNMSPGKAKDDYIHRLKTDIEFNIEEGIKILKGKWNLHRSGRIPTVNDNDPMVLDNWYFAILAYNGLLERNDPLINPNTAYQERVYNHIRQYSQADVTPFPMQTLDSYYLSNGNLAFRSSNYQIPGPLQYSSQSLESGEVAYTTAEGGLNLRQGPGTNHSVVTKLPAGTKVTINGNYEANNSNINQFLWYKVKTSTGDQGWVSSGYLNLNEYVGIYNLAGNNRFETSVAVSSYGWSNGSDYAVIGRGDLPIDALTGSVLASGLDSPLLLTRNDRLTPAVKQDLKRLQPKQVYILGGEDAISPNIEKELKTLYNGIKVVRLEDNNRYGTAVRVAEQVVSRHAVKEVFITTGDETSSDSLAIAPYAGEKNTPILLTNSNRLSEVSEKFIKENGVTKVTIIGGPIAVSENVEKELGRLVGSKNVERVSGDARFDTNLAIIEKYYNLNQLSNIFVAQGIDIADSLSVSPLAAKKKSPLVLTLSNRVPRSVEPWLKSKITTKPVIYFLGGDVAIQNNARKDIIDLVR